jgi:16S rRNA processing protein RimM
MSDAGKVVGTVAETFETSAHEILVVRNEGDVLFVPLTLEHVPEVDLDARRVVVRPPEG